MTKPSEILLRAAEILEPEGAWTRGAYAKDKFHSPVGPSSYDAVCWCASGAISKAGTELEPDGWETDYRHSRRASLFLVGALGTSVPTWNDSLAKQPEIVETMRQVAKQLQEQGE